MSDQRQRVSSPSAAKTEARRVTAAPRSTRAVDMALDIDHCWPSARSFIRKLRPAVPWEWRLSPIP